MTVVHVKAGTSGKYGARASTTPSTTACSASTASTTPDRNPLVNPSTSESRSSSPRRSSRRQPGRRMQRVSVLVPCYGDAPLVERSLPRLLEGTVSDLEVLLLNNDAASQLELQRLVWTARGSGGCACSSWSMEPASRGRSTEASPRRRASSSSSRTRISSSRTATSTSSPASSNAARRRLPRPGRCSATTCIRPRDGRHRYHRPRYRAQPARRRPRRERAGRRSVRTRGASLRRQRSGARRAQEALDSVRSTAYLDESFRCTRTTSTFAWRLRLAGWECWYVPTAVAYHARTSHGPARRGYLARVARVPRERACQAEPRPLELDEEPVARYS